MDCKIETKLLPLKIHYFMFNSGTCWIKVLGNFKFQYYTCFPTVAIGAIIPFLPTYARQLGFTSVAVGMMGTLQTMCALISRPVAGYVADRFKRRKTVILALLVAMAASFLGIHLVDSDPKAVTMKPTCANGSNQVTYCQTAEMINECLFDQMHMHRNDNDQMECMVIVIKIYTLN